MQQILLLNTLGVLSQLQRVFFLYDTDRDELVASHAFGDNAPNFSGLRIPRGERLTGWVAANKQTILNSDPVLDFGEAARQFKPRLKSCLIHHF